ncbi:hypothetical protein [Actinomadura sp. 3N407]|uniref:hypothetical protein n=1 Tax=Actinomadura sp. 3N407 TaxID=3457423 RepID=UPI003FCDE650
MTKFDTRPWDLERPVAVHPLAYRADRGEVTVGRTDIDSYAVFPADGAELIRELAAGSTPLQAAEWYAETYGADVDLADFLDRLAALRFLVSPEDPAPVRRQVRWQRLGRAVFSPFAWLCYALLLLLWIGAMARSPDLVPRYGNILFTDYYTLVVLTLFVGQIPALLIHEGFHALAGRRLGLRSRLSVGRRLYFIVFETSLDGLVMRPRRERYLPMLAGMLADVLMLAGLTLAADLFRGPDGTLSWIGRFCLALAFGTLMRLLWQFFLYLQTDVYFLVATVLGCENLHQAAKSLVRDRVRRLLGRSDRREPERSWSETDLRVARWYSWLLVAGYPFSILTLALTALPLCYRVAEGVLERVAGGGVTSGGHLLDSALFLTLIIAQLAVAATVAWRDRRRDIGPVLVKDIPGVNDVKQQARDDATRRSPRHRACRF